MSIDVYRKICRAAAGKCPLRLTKEDVVQLVEVREIVAQASRSAIRQCQKTRHRKDRSGLCECMKY